MLCKEPHQNIERACGVLAPRVIGQGVTKQLQRERIFAEQVNEGRAAEAHRSPIRTDRTKSRKQGIACCGIGRSPDECGQCFE